MTVIKTIQQWDIDTKENLAAFERESLEVIRKVDRAVHVRKLVTDSECLLNPYCDRDEFISWIAEQMEEMGEMRNRRRTARGYEHWGVIVKAVLFHRNGKPVRAEFRQEYGIFLDHAGDPNAGGIIGQWHHEFDGPCYLVEDENGKVHMDYELFAERNGKKPVRTGAGA